MASTHAATHGSIVAQTAPAAWCPSIASALAALFEGNGNVIISPAAHLRSLEQMGIEVLDTLIVGARLRRRNGIF